MYTSQMITSEVLNAIDAEIQRLQLAKSILADSPA